MNRDLSRLLGLVAPYWWRVGLAVLLGFATVASGVGLMATSAFLISMAALRPSIADLGVAMVGVRFFGIARGLFRYLERLVSHQLTFLLLTRVRVWFYRALEPLAPARLTECRSGDILARIVSDIESLENIYLHVIGPTLIAVSVVPVVWFLASTQDSALAWVVASILILSGLGTSLLASLLGRAPGRRLIHLRSELNASLVDGIQGVADLLAFDRELDHRAALERLSRDSEAGQARLGSLRGLGSALASFAADIAVVSALLVTIPLVSRREVDGVYLAVVAIGVLAAFEAIAPLPLAYQKLEESLAAARRLFAIVDARPAVVDSGRKSPVPERFSIAVKELTFSYPSGGSPPALDGVSFSVDEGKCVAIVGPSGAGKSTLVNLLLRFWDYSRGSILLGGIELRHLSAESVRRNLSVVSQSTYLFDGTVRENLLLARPEATQAQVLRVARLAQIDELVESLPDGYDTWIGEHGLRLSGGERQRLAIARALLKDAPVAILDEPTANLDPIVERAILRRLRTLFSGRTTLLVTHRLVELDWADEILVLNEGRIAERGTEADLLRREGLYRKMLELQRSEVDVAFLEGGGKSGPSARRPGNAR